MTRTEQWTLYADDATSPDLEPAGHFTSDTRKGAIDLFAEWLRRSTGGTRLVVTLVNEEGWKP